MRRYFFLLISIVVLLILALPPIISGNFTFVFDMGRDQLWTRNMVELRRPTLIGPWGSIAGVFFGPFWFYLLSVPYFIFNGDPRASVLLPLVANLAAMIIGWKILQKHGHPQAANFFAVLFGVSPAIAGLSSFAFHANLLPLATLLFFLGLYKFHSSSSINHRPLFGLPLSALMASLSFHLEPAAGVMLTGLFGLALIFTLVKISWQIRTPKLGSSAAWTEATRRSKHTLGYSIIIASLAFLLPFLPQFIFEFRHDFIQTKSLTSYFQGKNPSLMGELALDQRLTERITKLAGTLTHSLFPTEFEIGKWVIFIAFILLAVIYVKKKQKQDDFAHYFILLTLYSLLFHYLAYAFLFPAELKNWYLYGFVPLFIMSMSLILEDAKSRLKMRGNLIIIFTAVIFLINLNPAERFFGAKKTMPPETLGAQMEVVDWIYEDARLKALPFAVYTYTPPVYDFHYEYLLWWRGTKKYNLLPAEFSYRPGETSYSQYKTEFMSKQWKPEDAGIIYLIIEPDSLAKRLTGWMGNFPKAKQLETKEFPSKVKVLFGPI